MSTSKFVGLKTPSRGSPEHFAGQSVLGLKTPSRGSPEHFALQNVLGLKIRFKTGI